jgi:hypothetical protein
MPASPKQPPSCSTAPWRRNERSPSRDRADTIATFRWVSVHLMEMLARWVPSTPELEVKILFGRHIWSSRSMRTHWADAPRNSGRRCTSAWRR